MLRALVKAGVGVLAPAAALEANPVANAVAVVSVEDITESGGQVSLPQGAIRLAVSIKVCRRLRCHIAKQGIPFEVEHTVSRERNGEDRVSGVPRDFVE